MIKSALGKVTARGTCVGFTYSGDAGMFGSKLKGSRGNQVGSIVYVNGERMQVTTICTDLLCTPDGTKYAVVNLESVNVVGHRRITKRSPEVQTCIRKGRAIRRELNYLLEEYVKSVR